METQMQGVVLCDKIWALNGKGRSISPADSEFLPGFLAQQQDKLDHVCVMSTLLQASGHILL